MLKAHLPFQPRGLNEFLCDAAFDPEFPLDLLCSVHRPQTGGLPQCRGAYAGCGPPGTLETRLSLIRPDRGDQMPNTPSLGDSGSVERRDEKIKQKTEMTLAVLQ